LKNLFYESIPTASSSIDYDAIVVVLKITKRLIYISM